MKEKIIFLLALSVMSAIAGKKTRTSYFAKISIHHNFFGCNVQ